jgi:uncharacterized coiled-coil protein SlyX
VGFFLLVERILSGFKKSGSGLSRKPIISEPIFRIALERMDFMNQSPEVDQKSVMGLINIRELSLKCVELEKTRVEQSKKIDELNSSIAQLTQEKQKQERFARMGEERVNQLRAEILARARAIAQFTHDQERVGSLERLLQSEQCTPQEIAQWHDRVTNEFRALYATQPSSQPSVDPWFDEPRSTNWNAFRLAGQSNQTRKPSGGTL